MPARLRTYATFPDDDVRMDRLCVHRPISTHLKPRESAVCVDMVVRACVVMFRGTVHVLAYKKEGPAGICPRAPHACCPRRAAATCSPTGLPPQYHRRLAGLTSGFGMGPGVPPPPRPPPDAASTLAGSRRPRRSAATCSPTGLPPQYHRRVAGLTSGFGMGPGVPPPPRPPIDEAGAQRRRALRAAWRSETIAARALRARGALPLRAGAVALLVPLG